MIQDIQIEVCDRKRSMLLANMHFHLFYELYYLVSGETQYFIEDGVHAVRRGDVILIPPNTLHKTQLGDKPMHKRINLYFSEAYIADFLDRSPALLDFFRLRHMSLPRQKDGGVEALLLRMADEYENGGENSAVMLKSLLGELLVKLGRHAKLQNDICPIPQGPGSEKIYAIMRHINASYAADLSLSALSAQFYISPAYLSRSFGRVTGFSLVEYINRVRIRQAAQLLQGTDMNITQIARETGFSSANHFCKVFRTVMGMPPLGYRKSL